MKMTLAKSLVVNKHAHLLAVILSLFLSAPFFESLHPKIPFVSGLFLVALLFILRTLDLDPKVFRTVGTLGAVALLLQTAVNLLSGSSLTVPLTVVVCSVYCIFLFLCILLMGRRLFTVSQVTLDRVVGGINVYFLLGFLWTYLYYLIYNLDNQAFHFSAAPSVTYFFCFSFSTLATIGFGDMFPVNKWAMVLACLEGVSGQLFLAIFIARLVSLYATEQAETSSGK